MAVRSIECQLVQAQMKRYLAGADLPDELLDQLERHLRACPECKAEADRQREALGGAPSEVAQAVVSAQRRKGLVERLKSKVFTARPGLEAADGLVSAPGQAPFPVSPLETLKTPKNLVLSLSLAAVLVVMSTVMRQPSTFFGQRAASTIAANPPTDLNASVEAETAETKGGVDETPADPAPVLSEDLRAEAGTTESEKPAPVSSQGTDQTDPHSEGSPGRAQRPQKEAVAHQLDKVGGDVLIADSTSPVKKPPTKTVKAKPAPSKPTVGRIASPSTLKHRNSRIRTSKRRSPRPIVRVYQP